MFPIVGERYKCNDCEEAISFDLCGECYNTSSKLPGRFNQQHTPKHKFELVNSDLIRNIMRRLVSEHFEDSYMLPVLSMTLVRFQDGHPSHAPSDDTPENQEGDSHSIAQSSQIHEWNVQTKLPHETTYLDVPNATDGWNTIRDMVVHGAPAIAISAAISLAVEVFNMEPFVGTSENATSFLFNKLDYLVSSKPADVAIKLKDVITKSLCFFGDSKSVFQGSRLTTFELVHDKIPAALIADSIAAALMKIGRVNAVIVGVDRVAANGDIANKIGTYRLALCALHHGIPFFVVAPVTSIFPWVKKLLSRKDLQRNS
ncbi:hypothetical protein IFM89_033571 [Coptis chinensis]|uniref:ZZ-type domain-containing protein n=1 Tax=Coptis chinensis TaxID=261450 RepID=A0A835I7H9_9MAGN|nr:hypothetical protein IFM89_033571 [Coptis chinensis]